MIRVGQQVQNPENSASYAPLVQIQTLTCLTTGKQSQTISSKHRALCGMMHTLLISNRFLYMTVIALDANFRLRRRAISNEERDPALSSGWAYFVEDKPYREYLKSRVDNDEVSCLPCCCHIVVRLITTLSDKYMYRFCSVDGCKQQIYERVCDVWCCDRY